MKRFKIIALFLLIFSFGFSEEASQEELKARVIQLEEQIETQKKIIARYERLENKIDSRISQSLDLDKEVKEVHKENLVNIEENFQSKMNLILALIALVSILPIYDRIMSARTLSKIKNQEAHLETHQKALNNQRGILKNQEEQIKEDLEEHEEFNKKINESLGETYRLFALNIFQSSLINEKYARFESNGEIGFEYVFKAIKCYNKINSQEGIDNSAHVIYCVLYEDKKRSENNERSYWDELTDNFKKNSEKYPDELALIEKYVESLDLSEFEEKSMTLKEFLKESKR